MQPPKVDDQASELKELFVNELSQMQLEKLRRKGLTDFKEWKAQIIKAIQRESVFQFDSRTGEYKFILPKIVVKMVWDATLRLKAKAVEKEQLLEQDIPASEPNTAAPLLAQETPAE